MLAFMPDSLEHVRRNEMTACDVEMEGRQDFALA